MEYLSVKNFDKFQHYTDRDPPWIKLYYSILADYDFIKLSDAAKCHLVLIWLLASRTQNKIPDDPKWIKAQIQVKRSVDLEELKEAGFLVAYSEKDAVGKREKWHTRYIPNAIKLQILKKYDGKCAACGSGEHVEFDHIVPISKGGTGDESNIQLLCRSCNRIKRNRLSESGQEQDAAQKAGAAEQVAPQNTGTAETREETDAETKAEGEETPLPPKGKQSERGEGSVADAASDLPRLASPQAMAGDETQQEPGWGESKLMSQANRQQAVLVRGMKPPPTAHYAPEKFAGFINALWKDQHLVDALQIVWDRLVSAQRENPDDIIAAAKNYAAKVKAEGTGPAFMYSPLKFFDDRKWKGFIDGPHIDESKHPADVGTVPMHGPDGYAARLAEVLKADEKKPD